MNEFKKAAWAGEVAQFNYSGTNDPRETRFASACFTNGCTHHKGNRKVGTAYYDFELRKDFVRLAAFQAFWCPFNLDQVIENLNDINEVIPITYQIEETEEMFEIHLEISMELSSRVHFYVLTRVRYLYEFPQSALFYDVFRLRGTEKFSGWTLQNLYNLVVSAIPSIPNQGIDRSGFNGRSYWYDPYHSIPKNSTSGISELKSNKELHEANYDFSTLNNTYRVLNKIPIKIPYDIQLFNSLSYWTEEDGFNLRYPYYLENSTLYENKKKLKAELVTIENFEEIKKKILEIPVNLGCTQQKALAIISKDRQRRVDILTKRTREWEKEHKAQIEAEKEEQRKREEAKQQQFQEWLERSRQEFNRIHPRNAQGRFIKKV
jgi:hypothetical protein